MLLIDNIYASSQDKMILNGLTLKVNPGEIHAIMGTNGSGKSTLAKLLTGHPSYKLIEGQIKFGKIDISKFLPEERAELGIFLAFQYPVEVPGVSNEEFLRIAYNLKQKNCNLKQLNPIEFCNLIDKNFFKLTSSGNFLNRNVNEGFSGGEKKRNEILQMTLLDKKFIILDEIDSGLDIDSLQELSGTINSFISKNKSLILITHYRRLLDYIKPDFVHIMHKGKIIKTGNISLAVKVEREGYSWLLNSI
jgi:Fe-S cluster assembly ATP-binding protein